MIDLIFAFIVGWMARHLWDLFFKPVLRNTIKATYGIKEYQMKTEEQWAEETSKQEQGEPVCDKDPRGCWSIRCQLGKKCKNTPQTK